MKPLTGLALVSAVVAILIIGHGAANRPEPPVEEPKPAPVIALPNAQRLIALRRAGGEQAMEPYKYRRLIVSGNFLEAVKNEDGDPVVVLHAGNDADLRCVLEGKDRVNLSRLKRGETVYISGVNLMAGTALIHFDSCRIATPAEVEEAKRESR